VDQSHPHDLTLSGNAETARQPLIARHIEAPVLQQQMSRGGSATLKTQTDYNVFSNGLVLPASQSMAVKNNSLDKRLEFYRYTNLGKTLEQGKTGDKKEAYLWDYKKSLPVAQAVNTDSASIAYTSFESDGAGNWVIGSPTRSISGALTGHKWYTLNNDLSKSGLSTSAAYIVSYWTKNASPFNIAGTLTGYPVKGKTVNGWTYYMHKLSGQSSVTIMGTGPIDEVRLYPVDAQMTTFTYIPLVGISSQCDSNGKLSYYFYDALGRLKMIRDQDGNILKTLQYHYKGQ
jgi:YD repeat-containing protein